MTKAITVRLTSVQIGQLEQLAELRHTTIADALRQVLGEFLASQKDKSDHSKTHQELESIKKMTVALGQMISPLIQSVANNNKQGAN